MWTITTLLTSSQEFRLSIDRVFRYINGMFYFFKNEWYFVYNEFTKPLQTTDIENFGQFDISCADQTLYILSKILSAEYIVPK